MERRSLRKAQLKEAVIGGKTSQKIAVFDLDDTLIVSSAKIAILNPDTNKVIKTMTPAEFNHFKETGRTPYKLSFHEFEDYEILKNSTWIFSVMRQLLNFYNTQQHA